MTTAETIQVVEAVLSLPFILLGLSHIFQRQMWVSFFNALAIQGQAGVVWRSMALEIWPAAVIVTLHQDWTWPGVFITVYGHLLMFKVALSLMYPPLGLRSLQQADKGGPLVFSAAGAVLIAMGGLCGYRAFLV